MMGIGFPELMIILVIIMIIFGAGKLPEIGSAFGRSIKNFKTSMKEAEEEDEKADAENQPAAVEGVTQQQIDDPNLTDAEREALIRKKAQEEGDAKDQEMKETAEAFTDSLPRKGSYDFAKEQEEQKKS
jgi:sec-independent protein translocase protein TatA